MLFFGSLCLYAMGYGVYSLFSGTTVQLSRGLVKRTIETSADVFEQVGREDYGLPPGEGLFSTKFVRLAESCPILVVYRGGALSPMANARLDLTDPEIKVLSDLVAALNTFVAYVDSEQSPSEQFVVAQIDMLVRPIVNFVSNLPPTRIHANAEEEG